MGLIATQQQFVVMVSNLINYATIHGYGLRAGDFWRSTDKLRCPSCEQPHSYQETLKFNGRSQTLDSAHANRLAVDFVIERLDGRAMDSAYYDSLGSFWEGQGPGTVWGGRWKSKDLGHFELVAA